MIFMEPPRGDFDAENSWHTAPWHGFLVRKDEVMPQSGTGPCWNGILVGCIQWPTHSNGNSEKNTHSKYSKISLNACCGFWLYLGPFFWRLYWLNTYTSNTSPDWFFTTFPREASKKMSLFMIFHGDPCRILAISSNLPMHGARKHARLQFMSLSFNKQWMMLNTVPNHRSPVPPFFSLRIQDNTWRIIPRRVSGERIHSYK